MSFINLKISFPMKSYSLYKIIEGLNKRFCTKLYRTFYLGIPMVISYRFIKNKLYYLK